MLFNNSRIKIVPLEKNIKEIIIVSPTPQNLARGILWFSEHEDAIRQAIQRGDEMWSRHAYVIEPHQHISPSVFARKLSDLGYEKVSFVFGIGEFSYRGNIIEIAPINSDKKILIEFYGNTIETIQHIPLQKNVTSKFKHKKEFSPGDYVVHLDHGIGIFKQITKLHQSSEDFFEIEYAAPRERAKPDMLYVPISQKKKLDLYIGFQTPTIHRLGGSVWIHTRKKAKEDIERFAKELLALYQKRAYEKQKPMHSVDEIESSFAQTFPYEETEDQLEALAEIMKDLESHKPMDRILAGDVGFGKTEVAFRTALRVVANNHQVLFLAPTTILVEEHLRTSKERFKDIPITIEALSRLTPPQKVAEIIRNFREGKIDILIGTHRILSKDIASSLPQTVGLLIIDEEQRFGVKQKETLKNIRSDIHILSLSATPIPRTLSLALAHLREISVIKTPPPNRIPIQTFVLPYRDALVKEAIEEEMKRKGQIFFLHNRIETLTLFKKKIARLVPRARIECIHGRSGASFLSKTLRDFRNHTIDILIATTIIENGIDFPNANTLIVEDATRLGLSEAHQLRGRIGRGTISSFAYFLYRSKHLTEKALLRLDALMEASDFGAGYDLALKDLEIRGAGNVLGKEQSGTANKIGLNLYYHMLADAIEKEKQSNI